LNLLTPGGGIATGAVVSKGVESKIKAGSVGGYLVLLALIKYGRHRN
jgi:beta-glucosidase